MKKPVISFSDIRPTAITDVPLQQIIREPQRPESFLRLPEVVRRTGMCRAKIYRLEGFPKPIKVGGRTSAWIESEVDTWIAKTIAEARQRRCA